MKEEEVYKILNEIIADDSLYLPTVCWKTEKISINNNYGFTDKDKKFIEEQKETFKDFKLKAKQLAYYSLKKKNYLYSWVDTTCNEEFVYHLSFPLIAADRKKILISITEDCNCLLGGKGSENLYIKKDGRWKKIKTFNSWISKKNCEANDLAIN